MKRYDDEKRYKTVPNYPDGVTDPLDRSLWSAACKMKLATEEGLKGSDLKDIKTLVQLRSMLAGFSVDIQHCNNHYELMDLAQYGSFAKRFLDSKENLFGDKYIDITR